MSKLFLTLIGILLLFITKAYARGEGNVLELLSKKYEAVTDNLVYKDGEIYASAEINTNKQILVLPIQNTMHSIEPYQFKEYFSKSNKLKLTGRLLIERFVGNQSYFYEFIQELPQPEDLLDYYHLTESQQNELKERSIVNYDFKDRQEEYKALTHKIPSNEIPSQLLNFNLFNWAMSIVESSAVGIKRQQYPDVVKLNFATMESDPEIALIPILNLFKSDSFEHLVGNNLKSSLFAFKEHVYLNADRYADENTKVVNNIDYIPNIRLFHKNGRFFSGFHHEETEISVEGENWTLKQFNLCNSLKCFPKNKSKGKFVLKYEFQGNLFKFCQIDQVQESDEPNHVYRMISKNQRINDKSYFKALAKCKQIVRSWRSSSVKTSIIKDLKDVVKENNHKTKNIINFAISQKKVLINQDYLFTNRILKSLKFEVWGSVKNKFV